MAYMIANRYPTLCGTRAGNGLTALQMLACSPTAFKSGANLGILKEIVYLSM